jgi:hypothetical protein
MKTKTTTLVFITTLLALVFNQAIFAEDKKFNLDLSEVTIVVSSNQYSETEEALIDHLKMIMKDYFVVSKDEWTHNYKHEAEHDSTGSIEWTEDKTKVWEWMVRPGGLATVTDENGITTYLANIIVAK